MNPKWCISPSQMMAQGHWFARTMGDWMTTFSCTSSPHDSQVITWVHLHPINSTMSPSILILWDQPLQRNTPPHFPWLVCKEVSVTLIKWILVLISDGIKLQFFWITMSCYHCMGEKISISVLLKRLTVIKWYHLLQQTCMPVLISFLVTVSLQV